MKRAIDDGGAIAGRDVIVSGPEPKKANLRSLPDRLPVELLQYICELSAEGWDHQENEPKSVISLTESCYAFYRGAQHLRQAGWKSLPIYRGKRVKGLVMVLAYYTLPAASTRLICPLRHSEGFLYNSYEDDHTLLRFLKNKVIKTILPPVERLGWYGGMNLPSRRLSLILGPTVKTLCFEWRQALPHRLCDLAEFVKLETLLVKQIYTLGDISDPNGVGPDWLNAALWSRRQRDQGAEGWRERLMSGQGPSDTHNPEESSRPPALKRLETIGFSLIDIHDERLAAAGCFERLEHLRIQVIFPSRGLTLALLSCGKTLKALRLSFGAGTCGHHREVDTDAPLRDYETSTSVGIGNCICIDVARLFQNLRGGRMAALEYFSSDFNSRLTHSTSFHGFVEECPKLANLTVDRKQRKIVVKEDTWPFEYPRTRD